MPAAARMSESGFGRGGAAGLMIRGSFGEQVAAVASHQLDTHLRQGV